MPRAVGVVKTPGQLMAVSSSGFSFLSFFLLADSVRGQTRFLLGLFEGGLFPGLNFVFSVRLFSQAEINKADLSYD